MKKTCPENCLELLQQCGVAGRDLWGNRFPEVFYNTLELFPEFARNAKVHAMLVKALEEEPQRNRLRAARLLHRGGDPLGMLHLTYNTLSRHPLLGEAQSLAGLWPEAHLLREAEQLTDACIDLLIADLAQPHAFWHMDILAAAPEPKIAPRMRALLAEDGAGAPEPQTATMVAAYVLALQGHADGRAILEALAEDQKFLNLAVVGLSHIPNHRAISHLKTYASPDHPIYNRQYENLLTTDVERSGLRLQAECRLFLATSADRHPLRRTMDAYYLTSIQDMIADSDLRTRFGRPGAARAGARAAGQTASFEDLAEAAWRWIKPPRDVHYRLFMLNSGLGLTTGGLVTAVNAPDFLAEFSTAEDRAYCAEIQRVSLRALLNVIGWRSLGNGSDMGIRTTFLSDLALPPTGTELAWHNAQLYLPGVEISYTPKDYEHAAVDWILHPGRYRTLSYWPKLLMA
jgi:hypothetical protein